MCTSGLLVVSSSAVSVTLADGDERLIKHRHIAAKHQG
jgi:hypothetical protein